MASDIFVLVHLDESLESSGVHSLLFRGLNHSVESIPHVSWKLTAATEVLPLLLLLHGPEAL